MVGEGDSIEAEQPVLEVETDKAVMEVPCSEAGTVEKVLVSEGDTVKVGQPLLTLSADGKADKAKGKGQKAEGKKQEAPKPKAEHEQPKPKAESSEASDEKTSPKPKAEHSEASDQKADSAEQKSESSDTPSSSRIPVAAAPSTRQFAREIGVDIEQVHGTGPAGRISIEDVKRHARENPAAAAPSTIGNQQSPIALPDFTKFGPVDRQAMSNVRKKTAQHMTIGWTAPHVTLHDTADITDLEVLRGKYAKLAEKAGGKLTVTAIILKIVALGLRRHPQINCSYDAARQEIVHKDYVHIGVAADTPRGLVVPVLRDVDRKTIVDIAVELGEMAGKGREGKLSLDDMSGGSFTVTNLGGIGIAHFTPIINSPEVAILGVGRATKQPVWNEEEEGFEPRLMMPLSLSFDHRVVDGADGARFLRWVVEACANPLFMEI
jgi:pyruvate dehydrogenase E2 component (dihydrolipoamide acetyltransferase)